MGRSLRRKGCVWLRGVVAWRAGDEKMRYSDGNEKSAWRRGNELEMNEVLPRKKLEEKNRA